MRDGRITEDSTEDERYELLKGIAKKLGINKLDLRNSQIDGIFRFSNSNVGISAHHQKDYGGNLNDLALSLTQIKEVSENAVPIEVHGDYKRGTPLENRNLLGTVVMLSAYSDGKNIVPILMEVKKLKDSETGLYINVTLTKTEPGVAEVAGKPSRGETENALLLIPDSEISIADLMSGVNPVQDAEAIKYFPDGFLSDEQKRAKQKALKAREERFGSSKNRAGDKRKSTRYESRITDAEYLEAVGEDENIKLTPEEREAMRKYREETKGLIALNVDLNQTEAKIDALQESKDGVEYAKAQKELEKTRKRIDRAVGKQATKEDKEAFRKAEARVAQYEKDIAAAEEMNFEYTRQISLR